MTNYDEQTILPLTLPHGQLPETTTPPPPILPPAPPAEQPALAIPEHRLPGLDSNLFIQAHSSEATAAAPLITHGGVGAVYTLPRGYRKASLLQQARGPVAATRAVAPAADILVDRNRYSGKTRLPARTELNLQWAEDQLQVLQLPWAVADPGFCRTVPDVRWVLNDARRLPDRTIVPLPIPHELLRDDADTLLTWINDQDKPVAVILEHSADPFGAAGVASGLTRVIHGASVPVLLLRTDTSALGAISHGAVVGAVGAHSGLRHIYPLPKGDGGSPEHLSFVVPDLLTYVLATRFTEAHLRDPDLPLWRCGCWRCQGRNLSWIRPAPLPFTAAFQHSVAAVADLGAQLRTRLATMTPVEAWDQMCTTAQIAHDKASNPSGSPWAPQDFLAHWHLANSGVPVS